MASFLEIMLSGNSKEQYITAQRNEIEDITKTYRGLFTATFRKLECMEVASIETNIAKILGTAGKVTGNFIGSIPIAKESTVDEFLQKG